MIQCSFYELYLIEKRKQTHADAFVAMVSQVTGKAPATVRMWLNGKQQPDRKTRDILAKHFGIPASILFPPIKQR